jgi:hypothetical protein
LIAQQNANYKIMKHYPLAIAFLSAADGALKAAGQVGSTAVEAVRKAVTKPVNGVKVVLKEPEMASSKT